jgi:hypothetical protein
MKRLCVGLWLLAGLAFTGCNSSPAQVHGDFSLFTFDNRTYFELPEGATNFVVKARPSQAGHGSGARVYSDTLQTMVLYKSPLSASSNSTPISLEIPMVK